MLALAVAAEPRVTSLVRDDLLRTGRGFGRLWRAWSARGALPGDSHERQRSKWCGQTATSMELREREGGCEGWGDGPGVSLPQHVESTQRVTRVHIPHCTHSNKQTEVKSHRIVALVSSRAARTGPLTSDSEVLKCCACGPGFTCTVRGRARGAHFSPISSRCGSRTGTASPKP